MANVLNKDPFTYEEDRRSFLQDLHRFHASRGTPFDRIPKIGGKEVDLYRLYRRVIDQGGWQKFNNDQLWEDIVEEFQIPLACTNGTQALKYIYFRYLNAYEKVHFLGVDPDQSGDDNEEGPARKKVCLPVESVPLAYNYAQHRVPDSMRTIHRMDTDLARFSDYEKLEMALRSGLPNEVDFAINVCLLLSNEGRYVLKLSKSLHLLPLLMSNVGIFEEGPSSMEDVMLLSWKNNAKRDFLRFWYETVNDEEIRRLIKTKDGIYRQKDLLGYEVLSLGRNLGVLDVEGQRVQQLAVLIRNLSFEEINQLPLASSSVVIRFLMLCVHSTYGSLRQLALDTLGNVASQLILGPVVNTTSQMMIDLIKKSLNAEDKFAVVRSLEIVSKLCQLEKNESIMSEELGDEIYERMVQLLTVHDIQLIVHTLEALYQLSELGQATTDMIAQVKHAVDLLVNLITVEAQSYGPNSLVGIKVVEYVPLTDATGEETPSSMPAHSHVIQSVAPSQSHNSSMQHSPCPQSQQSIAEQAQADLEATTANWLQATFEYRKGACVTQADLYLDYQQFCRKFGVAEILSSCDFFSIVKNSFSQADVLNLEKEKVVKGLSKRAIPRPFAILSGTEKVSKPYSVNSPRGPLPVGTANWSQIALTSTPSASSAASPLTQTPTLRQRLMEPPRLSLQHQLLHTGTSSIPPTAKSTTGSSSNKMQTATPKQADGGGKTGAKKRLIAPMPPSGPGPGCVSPKPVSMNPPRPTLQPSLPGPRAVSVLQQHLVAPAPQIPTASVHPGCDQVFVQPSSLAATTNIASTMASSSSVTVTCASTQVPFSICMPSASGTMGIHSASVPAPGPGQQFPLIHQALQGDTANAGKAPVVCVDQNNDTNLIKSLLAKKLCQNMVRGNVTPSESPPPFDAETTLQLGTEMVQMVQEALQQSQSQQPQLHLQGQQQIQPQLQPQLQLQLQPQPPSQLQLQTQLQLQQQPPSQLQLQHRLHTQLQPQLQPQCQNLLQSSQLQQQQPPPQVQVQQPQVQVQQVLQIQQMGAQQLHLHQKVQAQQAQTLQLQPQQLVIQPQQQQLLLQTQQHLQLRSPQLRQPLILQQQLAGQQQLVIQPQPTLQQILHQPVQQLQFQAQKPLQVHTSQQLHFQQQQQQPQSVVQTFQIQLPIYSLPQITATQVAGGHTTFSTSTLVPTSVVQTSVESHQSSAQPGAYRTIIPNPLSSTSSSSSQRPLAPHPVGMQPLQKSKMSGSSRPSSPQIPIKPKLAPQSQVDLVSSSSIISNNSRPELQGGIELDISKGSSQPGLECAAQGMDNIDIQEGTSGFLSSNCALTTPSNISETSVLDASKSSAQSCRDSSTGTDSPILSAANFQNPLSFSAIVSLQGASRVAPAAIISPANSLSLHQTATNRLSFTSSPSQSSLPSISFTSATVPLIQSSPMSITQAILAGNPYGGSTKAGSIHPHTVSSQTVESHLLAQLPLPAASQSGVTASVSTTTVSCATQAGDPSIHRVDPISRESSLYNCSRTVSVSKVKECNGLGDSKLSMNSLSTLEPNGILGSPDSVSSELPPSPMNFPRAGVQNEEHLPNGVSNDSLSSMKECAWSKEQVNNLIGKAAKLNGVVRHLENGSLTEECGDIVPSEWRVPRLGEKAVMQADAKELQMDFHGRLIASSQQNGTMDAGMVKDEHGIDSPLTHRDRELVKQMSMEEVSMDSTDLPETVLGSRMLINGSKTCDVGRLLFSPDSSKDSDFSSDSFSSSIADSVGSDKHSTTGQFSGGSSTTSSFSHPLPAMASSSAPLLSEVPAVSCGSGSTSENGSAKRTKKNNKKGLDKNLPAKCEKAVGVKNKPPSKSKKKKSSSSNTEAMPSSPATHFVPDYMCEWASCRRCFDNARQVFIHVMKIHIPFAADGVCRWEGCEPLQRKKWSMVTHVQDHHCAEMALRAASQRRFQAVQAGVSPQSPANPAPAPALVYPPDAAIQAIKRFHIRPPFAEFSEPGEGPVTKHIRFTSALILRNLARYSSHGRRELKMRPLSPYWRHHLPCLT
ncbi:AT-rich interactive domain-containing protein 2-like isoform X2 [Pomacea canaliculata]|uniref:AT-rich interactive domain-containing protein 2-like isoform X2 n=1 Tax=Pomacea canaliculata TaxID=400727 RepID=UPI000D73CE84|nr:AT-rich interactive domain-containing protein 2-like isoform X2 [Pomacea canaliculata]